MHYNHRFLGLGAVIGVLLIACASSAGAAEKKFIQLGWDIPDTAFLKEHGGQMEKEGPFDGVIFSVQGRREDGKTVSTQSGWNGE